jgi:hypothetical protein
LGELESQDQEYDAFLAEVAALDDNPAGGKPQDAGGAARSQARGGVDATAKSFSNFATFPYTHERQRVLGWYQK